MGGLETEHQEWRKSSSYNRLRIISMATVALEQKRQLSKGGGSGQNRLDTSENTFENRCFYH
jgi:hypothetical protein